MNIFLSIIDCLKILVQALRFSVINIPIENNHSLLIRILGYVNPFYIFNRKIPAGLRIKNFLESLGPMFIKFGQLLSTRTDIVPVKITSHLKELTDQCKPFATDDAKKIIERSLNIKIDEVFKDLSLIHI